MSSAGTPIFSIIFFTFLFAFAILCLLSFILYNCYNYAIVDGIFKKSELDRMHFWHAMVIIIMSNILVQNTTRNVLKSASERFNS